MDFIMPPVLTTEEGRLRTVGFELEFGALGLEEVSAIIIDLYGGERKETNRFLMKVVNTRVGDFQLKMDSRIMTEKQYEPLLSFVGINPENEDAVDFVESLFSKIIPYELGTPAVPIDQISEFEKLRLELFKHKAKGTRNSILTAFATHINAEIPACNAETLLAYIRSFVILYHWIFDKLEIHITRRVYSFISPFPDDYVELVLRPHYHPDIETLIEDYHKHNPDRNRPLDMYPVFAWLKSDTVKQFTNTGNVKPRPTFHYRLPNSEVDQPDWCLAEEWNTWIKVEFLASKPDALRELGQEYIDMKANTFMNFSGRWSERMENWLRREYEKA
jgi:hypothetical protein